MVQTITEVTSTNVVVLNDYDAVIDFLVGAPITDVAGLLQCTENWNELPVQVSGLISPRHGLILASRECKELHQ